MTDIEGKPEEGSASITLETLPPEILARIPAACIDCSTARLRAYRGTLDRECPGPVDNIEITEGKLITGQFCRYPTGAESKEDNKPEVYLTEIQIREYAERWGYSGQYVTRFLSLLYRKSTKYLNAKGVMTTTTKIRNLYDSAEGEASRLRNDGIEVYKLSEDFEGQPQYVTYFIRTLIGEPVQIFRRGERSETGQRHFGYELELNISSLARLRDEKSLVFLSSGAKSQNLTTSLIEEFGAPVSTSSSEVMEVEAQGPPAQEEFPPEYYG